MTVIHEIGAPQLPEIIEIIKEQYGYDFSGYAAAPALEAGRNKEADEPPALRKSLSKKAPAPVPAPRLPHEFSC